MHSRNANGIRNASDTVDPRWLLKALAIAVASAAILGYATLCLLLVQGNWQLILHPSPTIAADPSTLGISFDSIRFNAASTGRPRLTAWWIPARSATDAPTILFLHDGRGSLSAALHQLDLLHRAGLNLFAIDYRGFGRSDPQHPSEARMAEDAAAALDYLVNTRHISAVTIIPYGVGLGASLAGRLAQAHPELPALIIDNPNLAAADALERDPRARFLPMHLLLNNRFDLVRPLATFIRPRLLITGGPGDSDPSRDHANAAFFASLPSPKLTVELPPPSPRDPTPTPADPCPTCPGPAYTASIARFIGEYLQPNPSPS